jgi:hypothetical protein
MYRMRLHSSHQSQNGEGSRTGEEVEALGDTRRDQPRQVADISTGRALLFRPFGTISWEPQRRKPWRGRPVLVEICIGLEINGYMPADGYVPPEF